MNNIVNIQGYTLHRHNNELMIEDLELGRRLGYERPHELRRLINRMLARGQIKPDQVFVELTKTPGGGRPGKSYYLSEVPAILVTTRSNTETAYEIAQQVVEVFVAVRKGELKPRRQDEVTVPFKRAETAARSTLRLCKMFGTETGMARAIAVEEVRRATGLGISRMIAGNQVEEVPLTPTRLGEVAGISAADINRVLLNNGMQVKGRTGRYEPTAKSRLFCTMNPFKSPHSEHTDYRPLWFKRVLEVVDLSRFDADTDPMLPWDTFVLEGE